ncbi:MAG: sensor histidine kinase [Thermoleophilia bacterium]|nr:sensor histidine kinase [Thermoleophilia bacterium]
MSLRYRIALATTVAVALVATLAAVAIYSAIGSELRGETADTLRDIARRSAGPGRPGELPHDDRRQPRNLGGAQGYLQQVDPDGSVSRDADDTQALPVGRADRRVASSGSGEVLHDDVTVDGTHLMVLTVGRGADGALQVARPLDEVDDVLHRAARVLVGVTLAGLLLALGLGLLVARLAIRPVTRFTREAEAIASEPEGRGRLDVTGTDEVSRLAASFNATLAALERSMDSQRQLLADAGHELRTPIASVRANVQVLEDGDRLPPEELAALRSDIVSELDELTELLSDVIELARGVDPAAPSDDVRLDDVVRSAAQRASRRGDSSVELDLQLEPSVVHGDGLRIARAVTNVVDNARKWSPVGGRVEIGLEGGVVRVRDHGPGFPEADLAHVFDRFWRAPDARSMPGSGLGLAIVQQAAESHGGWARASNAPDGGAVVQVSFGPSEAPADA